MDHFQYKDGQLHAESVALSRIAQEQGTPCYVYSRATLERHWHAFNDVFEGHEHLVCYAVKASSSLGVLNVMARLGSGFDIVSGGELERVVAAGGDPAKVVFSGVGKSREEMRRALELGIFCFNVESSSELEHLNQVAGEMGKVALVSLRVNPDVDAKTHPYISTGLKENKFGIAMDEAPDIYRRAAALEHINVQGVDCHIGSQLDTLTPFVDAIDRVLLLIDKLAEEAIHIHHFDIGGGLGINYRDEQPPLPDEYAKAVLQRLQGRQLQIIMEPGRAIAGNAGVLLTTVQYLKHNAFKNFAVVDAAMNDLLRPSLYGAWQNIVPLVQAADKADARVYDIVGPVCETGDFLGKDRKLSLAEGDVLAVRSAGAYGFSMSSNYNTRPRAPEVMVDGDNYQVIRKRETVAELFKDESVLDN